MSLFSKIASIFTPAPAELLCPTCERALGEDHDEGHCARVLSRRHFLSVLVGASIAVPLAPQLIQAVDVAYGFGGSPFIAHIGNELLTPEVFTREVLRILQKNLVLTRYMNRTLEDQFVPKIGDTINVRMPARFSR